MRLIIMFNICKQSHTTYSQLKSVYTRFGSCCLTTSGGLLSPKSPQSHPNRRLLTTEAKRVDNDHHLSDKQIDQLNGSNNLLLHCPKWDHMYDVFYGSRQSQQIDPKTHIKTTFDINSNDGNKETNLLDTSHEWKPVDRLNAKTLIKYYTQLAKLRLTGLVVLTTLSGYYMGLQGAIDPMVLTATLLGTGLTSGSATAINHYLEIPFDAQMKRTQSRPLVLGKISGLHAIGFATVSGVTGLTLLSYVNPLTAVLGASNLILYSFIYTPMKRAHIANTWVGAVVGAIPPIMGFTAANNYIGASALMMGLVLYSWQFPHFNALSWNMRHEYARAGFRMMSVTEPNLCLNTALRHSCLILLYSTMMCTTLTTWTFGIDSLPFNLYLIYLSYRFRQNPDSKSSRKLFFYSLIHLPAIIVLMCISKRRDNNSDTNQLVAINS